MTDTIHGTQPVLRAGAPLDQAKAAMILIHGRGASAESILQLANEFGQSDFAYLAPQAAGFQWYPQRFIAPLDANEPYLSSALAKVQSVVEEVEAAGIPSDKIIILGFSQGACLAVDYVARNAKPYGGAVALSGGLIGDQVTERDDYTGDLAQTPVFLGCSDVDFHIPLERVQESTVVFEKMGATVTERIYPGMGHTVNQDEVDFVKGMMQALV